jgi:hypothetical protein|tara:strand:- start:1592 stop:1837 length:246 start_codon:yes stop_codon:yes gene_type:complete
MSYNGWSNKETWLVAVWLGDDLQAHKEDGEPLTADYIEALVDDLACFGPLEVTGLMSDLLSTAMGEINYWELEQHYKEDDE